jgi:hypothetical protein
MKQITLIISLVALLCGNPAWAGLEDDQRIEKYKKKWDNMIPSQIKLQYAGSMGMFSSGLGWYYGRKKQWETDLFVGFIPKMNGSKGHVTITLKQTYTPFQYHFNNTFCLEPLSTGIYFNKIFGEYFWSRLPEKYPKGYYFWAVNTRFHVFLGQALTFRLSEKIEGRSLSFFYEFNTNDLYLISAWSNKTIGLKDIIGLSFGLRYRVF